MRAETMKTAQIYIHDLKELLEAREFVHARSCLREISPVDLAEAWDFFSPEERVAIFRITPRQKAIQVFEELDSPEQLELLNGLQKEDAAELLQELDPSSTGRMLRGVPPHLVAKLSGIMKKGGQEAVQRYLQFPPKTVGALMRGRYVTLDPKWNARQAVERIQLSTRLRRLEETHLDLMMVAGPDGRFLGTVSLKALVVAPRDLALSELMDSSPVSLTPEMDQEEALRLFAKYKLKSAPVVGTDGQIMGVVEYRDILDVAAEETEEDFAKMAGVAPGAGDRTSWQEARLRLPWLLITCFGGLIVSSVIKHYEATLAQIVALATFSPLIAGMGGNVGAQTATIIVRGLATGEVKMEKWKRPFRRELGVGLLLAVFYGVLVGTAALLFYGTRYGWQFAAVVATAMFVAIITSATLAAGEPFLFVRFGVDPATATGPLITTTTDLLSNTVYFSLATYLLL